MFHTNSRVLGWSCVLLCLVLTPVQAFAAALAYEFNTDGDPEGWTPWHSVGPFTVSGGVLHTAITGSDPYFGSASFALDASENTYVLIRMKMTVAGTNQIFWTTNVDGTMDEPKSQVFSSGKAGEFCLYAIDLSSHERWQDTITRLRIDPPSSATSGEVEVDFVRIGTFADVPPILAIDGFTTTDQVLQSVGQPLEIVAAVSNSGGQAANNVEATLDLPDGFVFDGSTATQTLASLGPSSQWDVSWTVRADNPAAGTAALTIAADAGGAPTATNRLYAIDPLTLDAWTPPGGVAAAVQVGETIWLGNDRLRIGFAKTGLGYGAMVYDVNKGADWQRMALSPSFSYLVTEHAGATGRQAVYLPSVAIESAGPDTAGVLFSGSVLDPGGHAWDLALRFELARGDDAVETVYEATTSTAEMLKDFEGPLLYVGAGHFGAAKDEGIFPGLEWLVGEEVSSSTLDITTAEHVRYVPHPHKVTVPWMAVAAEGAAVGLMWDTLTPWHGSEAKPSAVYAVPDRFEGKDASLMGLFVPTVPDYVNENEREAARPYLLNAGETLTLACRIVLAYPADSPLAIQDRWYARHGEPAPNPYPRGDIQSELQFTVHSFMEPLWIPDEQQWNIYLDGGSYFNAQGRPVSFMQALELGARYVDDPDLAAAYRARYDEALAAGAGTYSMPLPFYVGDPADAMYAFRGPMQTIIDAQWEDGSWRFDAAQPIPVAPELTGHFLGPDNAAEVGISGQNALNLAMYARITGDKVSRRQADAALEFMKQFVVPRAAQVWEVPVHTPDVLASAKASEAFLEGYLATGRADYLSEAVRWARTGLPFIYTWQSGDFDWMLYGSIPVMGASMYTGSWFGRLVQWNGLEYAHALLRLAPYDDSYDWETLGTGILVSGMYQQETLPEWQGTYRDFYDTRTGSSGGPLINPSLHMDGIYNRLGWDAVPRTLNLDLEGVRVAVTGGAAVKPNTGKQGAALTFALGYLSGEATYTLVAGITRPSTVTLDGAAIDETTDLSDADMGWYYNMQTACAVVKVFHDALPAVITVEGVHPRIVEILPDVRDAIRFYFNETGDFEGWIPVNDIGDEQVTGGVFRGVSLTGDPYAYRANLAVPAGAVDQIYIRMLGTAGSSAQFFYTTADDPVFDENKVVNFPINTDGQYHTYVLDMSAEPNWAGKDVVAIRIDPATAEGSDFAIDYVVGGTGNDYDGDGIPNETDGFDDCDNNGAPNFMDEDADGDGIPDAVEGTVDTDGDGTPDHEDADSDGDGIPDAEEGVADVDGDGLMNYVDLDSDGDGVSDELERTFGSDPYDPSSVSAALPLGGIALAMLGFALACAGTAALRQRGALQRADGHENR